MVSAIAELCSHIRHQIVLVAPEFDSGESLKNVFCQSMFSFLRVLSKLPRVRPAHDCSCIPLHNTAQRPFQDVVLLLSVLMQPLDRRLSNCTRCTCNGSVHDLDLFIAAEYLKQSHEDATHVST